MSETEVLEAIRARLCALGLGAPPWHASGSADVDVIYAGPVRVAYAARQMGDGGGLGPVAQFIAHSRQDVPWLLDRLGERDLIIADLLRDSGAVPQAWEPLADHRRLEAENRRLRAVLEAIRCFCDQSRMRTQGVAEIVSESCRSALEDPQ